MTNTAEEVDNWLDQFKDLKPSSRRVEREARAKQERRTHLTAEEERKLDKQRERSVAVRTEQINFRCSGDFKSDTVGMQEHLKKRRALSKKPSIADVLEEALRLLAKQEGYNG